MSNRFPIFLGILVLLLVILPGSQALAKKRYWVPSVVIVADVHADGSMEVTENRTYKFRKSYKYAYRKFPLGSGVNYADFVISENSQPYELSASKDPGTFTVTSDEDEIEVRWYFRARNESRTFSISYRVEDAVKRHLDGAVLYYQFIGDDFRKRTGNLEITVNPPEFVDQWKVRQWAHGPLWGNSATSNDGVVTASCEKLPRRTFFELRILYPEEIFGAAVEHPSYVVDDIVTEETLWADEANAARIKKMEDSASLQGRMKTASWAMPLLLMAAVLWFVKIARRYGQRPAIPSFPSSSPDVPSDLPPAMVQYLVGERSISGSAIMGTMLDLARRGFLEFKEEQELGSGFMGREKWKSSHFWVLKSDYYRENKNSLAKFEDMLVTFVFEQLAEGDLSGGQDLVVDMEAFKKNETKVQTFFGKWSKEVKKEGQSLNFFDEESFKGRNQGMWLGGAVMLFALPMIPVINVWAFVPGIGGLVLFLSSLGIVHHTTEGRILDKRWKGLRKYLTSQAFKKSEPSGVLNSIQPYFVYGVVLGMNKSHLAALGDMVPVGQQHHYLPWYLYHGEGSGFSGDSFGTSFSTAVAGVNSSMSSSAGAGGGATGGGGGGSGGGGGGAG